MLLVAGNLNLKASGILYYSLLGYSDYPYPCPIGHSELRQNKIATTSLSLLLLQTTFIWEMSF